MQTIFSGSLFNNAVDKVGTYATIGGIEAGLVEGAARYGVDAAKDIGTKGIKAISRTSSLLGWGGIAISGVQAYQDFRKGDNKAGAMHMLDASVNAALLGVTTVFPVAAPFTLAAGLIYIFWAATRD